MKLYKYEPATSFGCGHYEEVEAIIIPDGATNGDMIKTMLPNLRAEDNGGSIYLHYPNGGWIVFDRDWWNAPYTESEG